MPRSVVPPDNLLLGLGIKPKAAPAAFDYIIELEDQPAVVALSPDLALWKILDLRGVVVTAPGRNVDLLAAAFSPSYMWMKTQ